MSYTIKKTDGTTLISVPENEILTDVVPVALIGRGSTEYGEHHSNNFLHLLENFANTTPPANPVQGMLWFDTANGIMKVRKGTAWETLSGGGTGGSGSGVVSVTIGSDSILVFAAGNKVIAILSPVDITNANLPVNVAILSQLLPLRSRFPNGVEAGHNLATDAADYIYNGHVRAADASIWAGGGTPFAATTYLDLGATSIALSISNDAIVAAYSQAAVGNGSLPTNFTVNGVTMPLKAAFPNGLVAGLTLAGSMGIGIGGGTITGSNTGVTLSTVQSLVDGEASARASAILALSSEVSDTYALASAVTSLEAAFTSGTGQSTVATAIDYLITAATDGTANAEATTQLRSEITNSITGATNFADALSRINTSVSGDYAESSEFTNLVSNLQTGLGATSISQVRQRLSAISSDTSANSTFRTELESAFEDTTGETNIATAVQTMWTEATANGSSAVWELDIQAGGNIAGLQLVADSNTKSTINMRADQFKFWHPNTPSVTPFRIENNKVYIDNLVIQDGSIGTDKLTTLFITEEVYKGTVTSLPSANSAISGLSISTGAIEKGSKVIIMFSCNVYGSDGGGMWGTVKRTKSGGGSAWLTGRAEFGCPDEGGSSQGWCWSDTAPADGTYTYQIWGDEFGTCNLKNAHMIGIVQKQHNSAASDTGSTTQPSDEVVYDGESDYSGSGSTTSGTSGSGFGGSGGCVVPSSFMPNGKRAEDMRVGDELTVLDYGDMSKTLKSKVEAHRVVAAQPCLRIKSESGIWVECSLSTPLTLQDGSVVYGRDVLGKELAVQDKDGFRWEKITSVTNVGEKDVILISANNQTYAAGGERDRFIFTHNVQVVKQ